MSGMRIYTGIMKFICNFKYRPLLEIIAHAHKNVADTEAPMDKLRAAGYERPATSLEEGVRDYVQNFLARDFLEF